MLSVDSVNFYADLDNKLAIVPEAAFDFSIRMNVFQAHGPISSIRL